MTTAAAKIAERNLPKLLAVVLEAGGWDALKGFVAAFGGKRICIPNYRLGDDHPLVVAAGRAAADTLVKTFPANTEGLQVPIGGHSLKLMAAKDNLHLSDNELAALLGCTYRYAGILRKEAAAGARRSKRRPGRPSAPRDPRQLDIEDFTQQ